MKAALFKAFEGPDSVVLGEIDDPVAGSRQVVVRVRAAALNFFDVLMTRNRYQYRPELPYSPCAEFAGEIESVGPQVEGFAPGDRVCGYVGWGAARQKIAVSADALVRIPDGVSDDTASGVAVTYGTAMHGLKDRADLKAGESVAVLGAAGGAGLAAVEIAKQLGARVIAVASSEEKLAVCREHGADDTVDYAKSDLKTALKELTAGEGVDVVYDCVGGESSEAALRATRWQGRFLVIGFAAGDIPKIPLNLVLLKGCSIVGVFWGEFLRRTPSAHLRNTAEVLEWCASGDLRPHIHATYELGDVREAFRIIEERQARGKVVIRP